MKRILPYPHPVEGKPGFSSRFTKEIKDGKEIFGEAVFDIAVKEFFYDENSEFGEFRPTGKNEVRKQKVYPYIPTEDIKSLVRLGQILKRPILLKGEPGCGKTQLAKAVAFEWYGENYKEHFFEWHIKSSSKAADGLYKFDHLKRLRESQINNLPLPPGAPAPVREKEDLRKYRTFGPLAKAFLTSNPGSPSIILIDEIDKADIDFPNDLLMELDENRFRIPETGEVISAKYPPLIFITSNDEREMPEAFLRRCLFLFLKFPKNDLLIRIIKAHLPELMEKHHEFVDLAIDRFNGLRKAIEDDVSDNKRVSTSELLDWLKAYQADLTTGQMTDEDSRKSLQELSFYYQALLKNYSGLRREDKLPK